MAASWNGTWKRPDACSRRPSGRIARRLPALIETGASVVRVELAERGIINDRNDESQGGS